MMVEPPAAGKRAARSPPARQPSGAPCRQSLAGSRRQRRKAAPHGPSPRIRELNLEGGC